LSFLTLTDGIPDFSQAVISLWFRVPQSSIDAAVAALTYQGIGPDIPVDVPLQGIIPFITLGPSMPISFDYYQSVSDGSSYIIHPYGTSTTGPGYIGLKVYTDGTATLIARIQSSYYNPYFWRPYYGEAVFGNQPGTGDYFAVGDAPYYSPTTTTTEDVEQLYPAPDMWHHVLISMDLGRTIAYSAEASGAFNPNNFSDACKWQWALDDRDLPDTTLYPYGLATYANAATGETYSGEPHLITTPYMFAMLGVGGPNFSYSFPAFETRAIGIPSIADWVDHIHKVELAELQFFTGVTLDTSLEKNRRAFVDDKGKPVPPEDASKLLDKRPDILLHGSGNWIKGKNTGPTTTEPDDQFEPTGKIISYRPNPALGT
jgi:hypothetical protein